MKYARSSMTAAFCIALSATSVTGQLTPVSTSTNSNRTLPHIQSAKMLTGTDANVLTEVTAVIGAMLGSASLVLGICNYLRDRPKIRVFLQWNMELRDASLRCVEEDEGKHGLITITNEGRRTVFISHACLILPKSYKNRLHLLKASIQGQKLSEGDPPARWIVPPTFAHKYLGELKRIRAQVNDSTGRAYLSKYPRMFF